jgi:AraC-like DNA-binding protein
MENHSVLPLESFAVFEHAAVDELSEFVKDHFSPDRVLPIASGSRNRVHYLELDGASLSFGEFQCGLDLALGEQGTTHAVILGFRGESEYVQSGKHHFCDATHGVVRTGQRSSRWRHGSGASNLYLDVSIDTLNRHYKSLTNEELTRPIEFNPELASQATKSLMISVCSRAGSGSEIAEFPTLRTGFTEMLVHCLLLQQPNNHSACLNKAATPEPPQKQRQAEEFMRANADLPITMADVAGAAGMSVRSLARSFQKYRSSAPRVFLRQMRLERAHRMLLLPQTSSSVSKVAFDCGFVHLGRFSKYYSEHFGELPSETAGRAPNQRRNLHH